MPPSTIPPATTPTTAKLSGNNWVPGGSNLSGTSGTMSSGVYAEYTQWMTIEYARNPTAWHKDGPTKYLLNNVSATSTQIQTLKTALAIKVNTYNSCKIVSGNFMDVFSQPQLFALEAQDYDIMGYTHGTVSGFIFGPAGRIVTTQPYFSRGPSAVGDVEYDYTTEGVNGYVIEHYDLSTHCDDFPDWDNNWRYGIFHPSRDFKSFTEHYYRLEKQHQLAFNPQYDFAPFAKLKYEEMSIMGAYTTSGEPGWSADGTDANGKTVMVQIIESIVSRITSSSYYQRYLKLQPTDHISAWREENKVEQNPYYSTGYHDYT